MNQLDLPIMCFRKDFRDFFVNYLKRRAFHFTLTLYPLFKQSSSHLEA